jgi:cell division protease FtsH
VEKLANALLEREVLFQSDVEALIGKRPFEEKKSLAVDEIPPVEPAELPLIPGEIKNQDEKSKGEETGGLELAPSI